MSSPRARPCLIRLLELWCPMAQLAWDPFSIDRMKRFAGMETPNSVLRPPWNERVGGVDGWEAGSSLQRGFRQLLPAPPQTTVQGWSRWIALSLGLLLLAGRRGVSFLVGGPRQPGYRPGYSTGPGWGEVWLMKIRRLLSPCSQQPCPLVLPTPLSLLAKQLTMLSLSLQPM